MDKYNFEHDKIKDIASNDTPLLSICIPTYNRAKYLEQCLNSLVYQIDALEEGSVEVVISNNCSTDNTSDIIEKYMKHHSFIRYFVNSKNIGSEANVINLPHKAKGKYIWCLGDDDLMLDGALQRVISYLRNEDYSFIMLNKIVKNTDLSETILEKQSLIDEDKVYFDIKELCKEFGYVTNLGFISTSIFKRNDFCSIDAAPYLRTYFPQCGVFLEAYNNKKCIYVSDVMVCHRQYNQEYEAQIFGLYIFSICLCNTFKVLVSKGILEYSYLEEIKECFISHSQNSIVQLILNSFYGLVVNEYYISNEDWETIIEVFMNLKSSEFKITLAFIFNQFLDKYYSSENTENIVYHHPHYKETSYTSRLDCRIYSAGYRLFAFAYNQNTEDLVALFNVIVCLYEAGNINEAKNILSKLQIVNLEHPRFQRYCALLNS